MLIIRKIHNSCYLCNYIPNSCFAALLIDEESELSFYKCPAVYILVNGVVYSCYEINQNVQRIPLKNLVVMHDIHRYVP